MKFEYETCYFSLPYVQETRGEFVVRKLTPVDPNMDLFLENPKYFAEFEARGEQGWELVNVQSVLGGCFDAQADTAAAYGYGYSITAGFLFFWKREKPE